MASGIALSLLLAAPPAWSQAATGTIEGTVLDATGAVIPGATVQVTNPETGLSRSVTADERGYYTFAQLPVGSYELTVTQAGFAELKRTGIVLQVGDRLRVDLTLQVAGVQTEIVVVEASPVLEPSKTEVSTVVDQKLVSDLPLNGRNWQELVLLVPGVSVGDDFGQGPVSISFGGVEQQQNNIQVDGADNNNAFFAEIRGRTRSPFQFSQETIREFRVANQNYSAEFGRAGGGIVNAITKSGTNELHGTVFYYFRDDGLNAQDPISKSEITVDSAGNVGHFITQAPERRQQYGFNLGGPVIKDKLFFFFNMDNQERNEPRIVVLGDLGNEITDTLLNPPAVVTDPVIRRRLQGMGLLAIRYFGQMVRPIPRTFDQINLFPRIDWRVTENHTLSFTHNYQRWRSQNGIQTGVTSDDNLSAEASNSSDSWTNNLTLNSVLRPTLLNEFRFQFTWDNTADLANSAVVPDVRLLGVRFAGSDFLHSVPGEFQGRFTKEHRLQWVENLTWIKGRHTFKFGVDVNRVVDRNLFASRAQGSWGIRFRTVFPGQGSNSGSSSNPTTLSGGYFNNCINFAAFDPIAATGNIAGALDAALQPASCATALSNFQQRFFNFSPLVEQVNWDHGVYIQDTIRLHPRFTVYLGLRYEFQDLPEVCSTIGIPKTGDSCVVNPLEPRTGFIPQDGNNWAPRLGFAWQPWEKWVVRGGYGVFYARTPSLRINDALTNSNFFSFNQFISCSSSSAVWPRCQSSGPASVLVFPNPLVAINPTDPSQTTFPTLPAPTTGCPNPPACADPFGDIFVFAPNRTQPYVQQGSLEIERQIGNDTTIAASYLWTHGIHIDRIRNTNSKPVISSCPTLSATCARIDVFDTAGNLDQQFFITRIDSVFTANRPNPNFRQILTVESESSSIYHGFGLRIQHRFSQGFSFLTSWTISKNIDTIRNALGFFSDVLDPFNTDLDRGLSSLDRRQRFVTSWVWEPPYLRDHDSRAVRALFANWRFTGIFTAVQGRPVTADVSGGSSDTDFNEDNVIFDRTPTIGRNTFRGPGSATIDFGVSKLVRFGERARAEFTFQAFNLFNSPVYLFFDGEAFTSTRSGGFTARVFTLVPRESFLQPTNSRRGRDIQLGFRFTF